MKPKSKNLDCEAINYQFSNSARSNVAAFRIMLRQNPGAYDAQKVVYLIKRMSLPDKYSEKEQDLLKFAIIASTYRPGISDHQEAVVDFSYIPSSLVTAMLHVIHHNEEQGFTIHYINQFNTKQ